MSREIDGAAVIARSVEAPEEFAAIYKFVESVSGGDDEKVQEFFKTGMLINVAAAMDLGALDSPWAHSFLKGCLQEQ